MKKYIVLFITLITFLSFTHTAWAKQITSVVKNDSVLITVSCKLCDVAVPGFITIKNTVGGATQKQTFTNLKKDKALSFTFNGLELGRTYSIEIWSNNSEAINDDGVHAYIKGSFTTPKNATSPPGGGGNTTPLKVDVKKSGTTATISVTCYEQCNGLKGGATVTGDGYNKTSIEKTLKTGVATVYTFEGLTVGKAYSVLGQPALPDGTIYTWKSSFTMDANNTGPETVNADIPTEVPSQYGAGFTETNYKLLAPIGGLTEVQTGGTGTCATNKDIPNGIGCYLNTIFLLAIGLCGVLAVIMIVVSSIQYMGDESVFGKTEAKGKIVSAILGLLLALGSYALLRTIDPALTGQNGVNVSEVLADIEGDAQAPVTINDQTATSAGILCPKSGGKAKIPTIAKSFAGRMTYSQDIPKGQPGPNGTIKLDCSGYVNYVLKCAGIDNKKVNSGTSIIFNGAEKIDRNTLTNTSANGKAFEVGDLIGWRPQDSKHGGHVMIYIGDGQVVNDSHGGSTNGVRHAPGKAYGSFPVTKYKDTITYIRRISTI